MASSALSNHKTNDMRANKKNIRSQSVIKGQNRNHGKGLTGMLNKRSSLGGGKFSSTITREGGDSTQTSIAAQNQIG